MVSARGMNGQVVVLVFGRHVERPVLGHAGDARKCARFVAWVPVQQLKQWDGVVCLKLVKMSKKLAFFEPDEKVYTCSYSSLTLYKCHDNNMIYNT